MKGTEKLEKLQDANRKLRAQVRALRKALKEADYERALLTDLWAAEIEELKKKKRATRKRKNTPTCPDCGNPTLDVKQVGVWKLERCSVCDYFSREQVEDANI